MHRDYAKLPLPDEAIARERYLRQGVAALDLATMKDFIRFHARTSRGKIADKPTADSVNQPEATGIKSRPEADDNLFSCPGFSLNCFLWAFNILRWPIRVKKLKSLEIQRSRSLGRVGSSRHDEGCKDDL